MTKGPLDLQQFREGMAERLGLDPLRSSSLGGADGPDNGD
jgi:hypothetical protein